MERSLELITGPKWQGVNYFTTTRMGGVSQASWAGLNLGQHCGDDPMHVAQNRALLRQELPSEPHWIQQVHGTGLYRALRPAFQARDWGQAAVADAAWTTTPNTVLAILTADCLPVVIANAAGTVLGVAHAGWRGLADGVLERLMAALQAEAGADARWRAWIGPAISQTHFEVGKEVVDIFCDKTSSFSNCFIALNTDNKYLADLGSIAKYQLLNSTKSYIEINLSHACTYAEEQNYFSYRRQAVTGRIATLAWLT